VSDLQNFAAGYDPAILALFLVFGYYSFVTLFRRGASSGHVSVPSYSLPAGASPAVAAWLLERNDLPRAVAAALVNMAAKGYLKIEQSKGSFSVVKLDAGSSVQIEPEEDALTCKLFRNHDTFGFDNASRQLADAIKAFRTAMLNTSYMSTSTAWFVPAWIVSSCAIGFALFQGTAHLPHPSASSGRSAAALVMLTFWCFSVALRTLSGPIEKLASRLPGSTAPRRPWTGADGKPITYLLASFLGVGLLGLVTSPTTGMISAAFLVINVAFFHAMQDLTPAGTEVLDRLNDYKRFLSAVDAGPISQLNSPEEPPVLLTQKNAYAIAFHVDRGWGEQLVSSIAGVIECTEVFHRPSEERRTD
jgi:Predicted membrane protein (DUF2207)